MGLTLASVLERRERVQEKSLEREGVYSTQRRRDRRDKRREDTEGGEDGKPGRKKSVRASLGLTG
jgi:hypothetical protein